MYCCSEAGQELYHTKNREELIQFLVSVKDRSSKGICQLQRFSNYSFSTNFCLELIEPSARQVSTRVKKIDTSLGDGSISSRRNLVETILHCMSTFLYANYKKNIFFNIFALCLVKSFFLLETKTRRFTLKGKKYSTKYFP